MRNNLPVSEQEHLVPEESVLVSKTDLKGIITYCSKEFSEISGFLEFELLGMPHNVVRHPDMPSSIFANCWKRLAAGKTWHGIIKNRRKNGDYYWVHANISPLQENGQCVGYVSLRYKATPEQISQAKQEYQALHEGGGLPSFFNKHGKDYVATLQQRLAEKLIAQEEYLERYEQEQRIAVRYMDKLIALDSLSDPAVQFHIKPAENFNGDLIAISRTPDDRLHLLLADSTGHGLFAALAAMQVIHPFYSMTSRGFTIQAIAKEINGKVWESLPSSHFVAAILVSLDSAAQMVEVWSGGCPPPVVLNELGGCVYQFKPRHLAMGILPPEQFDASVEYFSFEDNKQYNLLMFSDGVIELKNTYGEQFGLQRLLDAAESVDINLRWEHIVKQVDEYRENQVYSNDDVAMMLVRFDRQGRKVSRPSAKSSLQASDDGTVVWQFDLTLAISQIKKLDVVPLLLDIVQQIERDSKRGGEIFMILSEMFNNALDHGLLKLDSKLKNQVDGLEKYFEEREVRLANIKSGEIQLNLEKVLNTNGDAFLRIRIKDSGEGFDFPHEAPRISSDIQFHGRGISLLYSACRSVTFTSNGSNVEVEFDLQNEL